MTGSTLLLLGWHVLGAAHADDIVPSRAADAVVESWQDLNADGINDLLSDRDGDQIPDKFQGSLRQREDAGMAARFALPDFAASFQAEGAARSHWKRLWLLRDLYAEQASRVGMPGHSRGGFQSNGTGCAGGQCGAR